MKQIILTLRYRHDGQKNMKDMELRILFCWAGNVYNWYGKWPFPVVPSPGDTLSIQSLIEEGVVEAEKDNIVFRGSCLEGIEGLKFHWKDCFPMITTPKLSLSIGQGKVLKLR